MQLPPGGWLGVEQHRRGGGANLCDRFDELFLGGGVYAQVVAAVVQAGGAAGDPVGEVGGVFGGGFHARVAEAALVGVEAAAGFQPGALGAQPAGGGGRRHRVDVFDQVDPAGPGQHDVEPAVCRPGRVW